MKTTRPTVLFVAPLLVLGALVLGGCNNHDQEDENDPTEPVQIGPARHEKHVGRIPVTPSTPAPQLAKARAAYRYDQIGEMNIDE